MARPTAKRKSNSLRAIRTKPSFISFHPIIPDVTVPITQNLIHSLNHL
jgi:hypothetical protein